MLALVYTLLLAQPPASQAPPSALEMKALQATVRVYTVDKDDRGSAVAIGRQGAVVYLLTAAHLVRDSKHVDIHVFAPGDAARPRRLFAKVEVVATATAQAQDLALLRVVDADRDIAAVLPLRKAAAPVKTPCGAQSAGCTDRGVPVVQSERVLDAVRVRKVGAKEAVRCFKCKTPATAGRSGGPLLDGDGRLLGIASGGDGSASYFIHVDEIRPFLKRNGLSFLAE